MTLATQPISNQTRGTIVLVKSWKLEMTDEAGTILTPSVDQAGLDSNYIFIKGLNGTRSARDDPYSPDSFRVTTITDLLERNVPRGDSLALKPERVLPNFRCKAG
jgi:hypothetical protein